MAMFNELDNLDIDKDAGLAPSAISSKRGERA
jgi:hypothetical protein